MSTRPADGVLQAANEELTAKVQGLEAQVADLRTERDQARNEAVAAAELENEYAKKEVELEEAVERCHAAEEVVQ